MTATVLFTEHPAGSGPHRSIVEARSRYRGVFGTTWYDDSICALVTRNERMHAVMMPELLGVAVVGALGANASAVIGVGAGERCVWTFLTAAPAAASRSRSLALFTRFVIQAGPGALIALPTPGNPRRQWVCEPGTTAIPAFELVADAIVAVSGR
ncbi:hypothetical protein AB0L57_32580 [Nocardia sp. NPDC052254]|uniref:hypothetical protein n=1 Tax=Nocardia sp. NPDC052254 TaxID=3155681 RepID=UPI0034383A22